MQGKKRDKLKIWPNFAQFGYRSLLFLIIPVVFFILGMKYLQNSGIYFQKCVDPEYSYLLNGLLLADLHFDLPYVYHPGTPVHCITAVVIRVVNLFRPGNDVVADVLKNPEIYIHATILTVNLLTAVMLAFLGLFIWKKTRNIYPALFLQLIPFVHIAALEPLERLVPEALMVMIICLWLMLIVTIITDEQVAKRWKKYSLALGIMVGLGIADKLTFAPFALIPLFILPGWRYKLRFVVVSVISFFVFAFPIALHSRDFYNWVKNIITHTGSYGGGDLGFVHFNVFIYNIKLLIRNTPVLFFTLCLLVCSLTIFIIKTRKSNEKIPLLRNLSFSLVAVVCLQYLMTAKQFSYYYMLPSILMILPITLLSVVLIRHAYKSVIIRNITGIAAVGIFAFCLLRVAPLVLSEIEYLKKISIVKNDSYRKFSDHRSGGPIIISASYYGCSSVEYALIFGIHTSGKYGDYLSKKMKVLYPSTYLFFPWDKHFYEWNREISPSEFMTSRKRIELYISEYSGNSLDKVLEAIKGKSDTLDFNIRKVYIDTTDAEALYILQQDEAKNSF